MERKVAPRHLICLSWRSTLFVGNLVFNSPMWATAEKILSTAVRNQLAGMKAPSYEVGVRNARTGQMIPRTYTEDQVAESIPWLKKMNQEGADIYIRPEGSVGLILLDDLTGEELKGKEGLNYVKATLKAAGHEPAVLVETSPDNYQAWIRVSNTPIPAAQATAIAKELARIHQSDPNSADFRHYGRLAGFTNRKPKHQKSNGDFPFAILRGYKGRLCKDAPRLLEEIQPEGSETGEGIFLPLANQLDENPVEYFQSQLGYHQGCKSPSEVDFAIVCKMLNLGFDRPAITTALDCASPNLAERKAGHLTDYINRTIDAAIERLRSEAKPFSAL